jgi:hypothetical protein
LRLATLWWKDVRARRMECQREVDQRMEGWTDRQWRLSSLPTNKFIWAIFFANTLVALLLKKKTGILFNLTGTWISAFLTLNLLTTTIVAPPSNASKWQMGFNSAFKGLRAPHCYFLSWDRSIYLRPHFLYRQHTCLILPFRLHLGFLISIFASLFLTKILCASLFPHIRATHHTHLIFISLL